SGFAERKWRSTLRFAPDDVEDQTRYHVARVGRRAARRPPRGASPARRSDRRADARHARAFRRATDLGDGPRRLVPGVLAAASARWRGSAADRLGRHLRLVQRLLHTALGALLSVAGGDARVRQRDPAPQPRAARIARAERRRGVFLYPGRATRGHARREPDGHPADARLRAAGGPPSRRPDAGGSRLPAGG